MKDVRRAWKEARLSREFRSAVLGMLVWKLWFTVGLQSGISIQKIKAVSGVSIKNWRDQCLMIFQYLMRDGSERKESEGPGTDTTHPKLRDPAETCRKKQKETGKETDKGPRGGCHGNRAKTASRSSYVLVWEIRPAALLQYKNNIVLHPDFKSVNFISYR